MSRASILTMILTVASFGCQSNSQDNDKNHNVGAANDQDILPLASESKPVVLTEESTFSGAL